MKRHRFKRSRPGEQFLLLPFSVLKELREHHLSIFIDIASRHNGDNNGQIGYGCRDGAKLARVSKDTANQVLADLRSQGLIRMTRERTFAMKAGRTTREWHIPLLNREKKIFAQERKLKLEHWFLRSHGWQQASSAEKKLYIELERRFDGGNNGDIKFGGDDGAAVRFTPRKTQRVLKGIERLGLVAETRPADPLNNEPRTWRLTRWPVGRSKATKEFVYSQRLPREKPFFGPSGDADKLHTVLPVSLGKQSGSLNYSSPQASNEQKPAENNVLGPSSISDTTRTVTASAGDTTGTHIETIASGSPIAHQMLHSGFSSTVSVPSTSKTPSQDLETTGGPATSNDELVRANRVAVSGSNR